MSIKQKIDDFNKRWNITPNEEHSIEFQKFKTRILNILQGVDGKVETEGIVQFCNLIGKSAEWQRTSQEMYSVNIIEAFQKESNEIDFYRLIEFLFLIKFKMPNLYIDNVNSFQEYYFHKIKEVLEYSNVNVNITEKGGDIMIYPKGESLLDENLVNEALSFLNKESNEHFIQALKFYDKKNGVKSAESLRRCLEEYLKHKLNNSRGLNNNIAEVQKKLKDDGKDARIRNIVFSTFSYLDEYFNENSKHNDGVISESENEFLIYQVGLLMRYINGV